jgi:hypothetical protein
MSLRTFKYPALLSTVLVASLLPALASAQDNAAQLDGAGDFFYAGLLNPGANFTFEAWTRLDSVSTGQAVVSASSLGDSLNAFYLGYFANTGQWMVELDDDDMFEGDDCASNNTLCVNVTQSAGANLHLAVVVQGTTMTLYLNGIQVGTEVADTPPVFASDIWILGAEADGGSFGTDPFIGLLDEVRVWSVARSEADIQCTMDWALTGTESGLYARWAMDESVLQPPLTATDSAGGFDATLFGNPTFIPSPFGLAQSMGGDTDCFNTDNDDDGYTTGDGDCDDTDAAINPGATEVCNSQDDNCDGVIDEGFDVDGDGFKSCGPEADCNDSDAAIYPGATEICDGADSDCDGDLPEQEWDLDGDLWVECNGDCDDGNAGVNPGAIEACNGEDDNCDDQIGGEEFDSDGDSYRPCSGDCDDTDPAVHPLATEDCCDGIDNDCDGLSDSNDPDCDGGDDDDDSVDDDDDTSWLNDDDDSAQIIERRGGCDCGDEVTGQTGLSLIFALGLLVPWRRRRLV